MDPRNQDEEIRPGVWSRGRRQSDPRTPSRPPLLGGGTRRRCTKPDREEDAGAARRTVIPGPAAAMAAAMDLAVRAPAQPPLLLRFQTPPELRYEPTVFTAGLVGVDATGGDLRRRRRIGGGGRGDEAMGGRTGKRKEKDQRNCVLGVVGHIHYGKENAPTLGPVYFVLLGK